MRFKRGSSGNSSSTSDTTWDYSEQMGCTGQWDVLYVLNCAPKMHMLKA